ncbi:MAG TPA: LON peptidase substrate-binding domain-containing protein [Pyrinomonadaceae bacterium]|nr:LON peptidase substrate-binding domain-containing protein [Pyrinomonadaceae bacterium]
MSEALQKVAGSRFLPIFPLPLVMLPNELLPLHIFEDRYRKMLKDVEEDRKFFGITLFEPQGDFDEKPAIGTVGCVAEVRDSETLEDGRSNILTLGVIRYRLVDYVDAGEPYLVGDLDFFEDDPEDPAILEPLADDVFAWFERLAKAAFKMGGSRGRFPEIARTDPESLSFLITAAFNFDNEKKYSLLKMTSTVERLKELNEILTQAVTQMEETADLQTASRTNGHSKKNIDL